MGRFSNIMSVLLIASVLFTGLANAQTWQLYTEQDGIRIEYKYADCYLEKGYDQQWVLLRITNASADAKLVEWKSNLWYNDECKTCNVTSGEYHKKVSVGPGKTLEGKCSIYEDGNLTIFVKFIDSQYQNPNKEVLTKFELEDLSITTSTGR